MTESSRVLLLAAPLLGALLLANRSKPPPPPLEGGIVLECDGKLEVRAWVDAQGPGAVEVLLEWDSDLDGKADGWVRGEAGGKCGLYLTGVAGWWYRARWGLAGEDPKPTHWIPCQ